MYTVSVTDQAGENRPGGFAIVGDHLATLWLLDMRTARHHPRRGHDGPGLPV